jgi:hypothetical protein
MIRIRKAQTKKPDPDPGSEMQFRWDPIYSSKKHGTRKVKKTKPFFVANPAYLHGQLISVVDPDPYPDWIRIRWGPWIRIQEGKNDPQT